MASYTIEICRPGETDWIPVGNYPTTDPVLALRSHFTDDVDLQCIENRPFEGDVWRVRFADFDGRYLTRKRSMEPS